jgi:hypothetical protein
VSALPRDALF